MIKHSRGLDFYDDIAIVGMACRFPAAENINEFWSNLIDGKNSIRIFNKTELLKEPGFDKTLLDNPDFIAAKGYLEGAEEFAADFFQFSAKAANITDPQFRLFLECVWHAWEDYAHDPYTSTENVGVYASSSTNNSYYNANLAYNIKYHTEATSYEQLIRNARDFMATLAAYHYDFKGPCINIQTACSSSLVSVCYACNDLRLGICDVAVVGAASISFPLKSGYIYKQGMIFSKDGYCQPFSINASGIVGGNGVGVVILKSLKKAISSGDHIYAIIKGYAVDNDGKNKLSFTAPSYDGQLTVLRKAAANAGVDPYSLTYIEAHGTGTKLGDQIEVAALKEFLTTNLKKTPYCYLGSVKSNIGHLDVAAGLAGLIKTTLALKHKTIPKTLHCEEPNPELAIQSSPLKIANQTTEWLMTENQPRRAGVSSFGVGGTNAHVILEEWAQRYLPDKEDAKQQIILLSAKFENELERASNQLAAFLHENKQISLADVACTLQIGRAHFSHRLAINCGSHGELIDSLYLPIANNASQRTSLIEQPKLVFLCGNTDIIYEKFTIEQYCNNDTMQALIQNCFKAVKENDGLDLFSLLGKAFEVEHGQSLIADIHCFLHQYFLLHYWKMLGVLPEMLFGFELGEYVAACYAGVFSFADAIKLLQLRSKILVQSEKQSCMLVIAPKPLIERHIEDREIKIRIMETPNRCVVSGEKSLLVDLGKKLAVENIITHFLQEETTLSSSLLTEELFAKLKSVNFASPHYKIIPSMAMEKKNVDIASANYWLDRLKSNINIVGATRKLLNKKANIFLEIGAKPYLIGLLQQTNYQLYKYNIAVFSQACSLMKSSVFDVTTATFASLWSVGVNIDWHNYRNVCQLSGHRISLPVYPFNRDTYLIEADRVILQQASDVNTEILHYLYQPRWLEQTVKSLAQSRHVDCIVLAGESNENNTLKEFLKARYPETKLLTLTTQDFLYAEISEDWLNKRVEYWLNIIAQIPENNFITILYTWPCNTVVSQDERSALNCFYDLVAFGKAVGKLKIKLGFRLLIITNQSIVVHKGESAYPYKSMLLSIALCLPVEYVNIEACFIDIDFPISLAQVATFIESELFMTETRPLIAYRNGVRLARFFKPKPVSNQEPLKWRQHGVYLITGGVGGIGLLLASYLAKQYKAHLILISRTKIPPESQWKTLFAKSEAGSLSIEKLQALLEIRTHAASLSIYNANVSDLEAIQHIVEITERQVGEISAVVHAAAQFPQGLLQQKRVKDFQQMFEGKISGTNVLMKIFAQKHLDFMLLFSSLSAIRGAMGVTDYIAANIYLDTYALTNEQKSLYPILSIGWDAWSETGMRFEYLSQKRDNVRGKLLNSVDWKDILQEHKLDKRILLPGAFLIDLGLQCLFRQKRTLPITFSNFAFLQPGFIDNFSTETHQIYCKNNTLTIEQKGQEEWITLARANISELNEKNNTPPLFLIPEMQRLSLQMQEPIPSYSRNINFGDHWSCLQWVKKQGDCYLAKITLLPKYQQEVQQYFLHPSLLDVGMSFYSRFLPVQHLPFYIQGLTIYKRLPASFYSYVDVLNQDKDKGVCECKVIIFDEESNIILSIDSFILKAIKSLQNSPLQLNGKVGDPHYGLTNEEGLDILSKILRYPEAHIIVSKSENFEKTKKHSFYAKNKPKPQSIINYDKALIDQVRYIWQTVIEVDSVADDDDFFEIGGDSLYSIEVCYRLKTDLGIEVAPHVLLEFSTLASFTKFVGSQSS